ncbi:hypothetical protein Y597_6107 [Burkholderia pseudomallei MSHR1000]|nr:hypothetical protein Y597_6107 [Burkholderia pseudomallei MSHR1000]
MPEPPPCTAGVLLFTGPPRLVFVPLKWSSNFGHCSGIGCERFETRWRQSLRSRVKATMVVKID